MQKTWHAFCCIKVKPNNNLTKGQKNGNKTNNKFNSY